MSSKKYNIAVRTNKAIKGLHALPQQKLTTELCRNGIIAVHMKVAKLTDRALIEMILSEYKGVFVVGMYDHHYALLYPYFIDQADPGYELIFF